ncbi:hypothetical protein L1F30_14140 [Simiduia sp. 21SJ11W-1]|uniref:hypothetical protein n=1 Tax=Simiduia sp. 21SJ11W-1 TaxID=2909669 RepID=UPI00209FE9C0|nr:hypothetical protein [Simiduia sp. 21SJ11W-1]UTA47298.1 hypothetical protein L1F30_14140 [Simiduia sp. 21SJ11W-1]
MNTVFYTCRTSLLLCGTLLALCIKAHAGESISPTFFSADDSALSQARTDAIHFHLHARTEQEDKAASATGLIGFLAKALTPGKLERPVHEEGFRIHTQSDDKGFALNAAYRF